MAKISITSFPRYLTLAIRKSKVCSNYVLFLLFLRFDVKKEKFTFRNSVLFLKTTTVEMQWSKLSPRGRAGEGRAWVSEKPRSAPFCPGNGHLHPSLRSPPTASESEKVTPSVL